jgi:bacterioferritin
MEEESRFVSDVEELRRRAREHIERGAVTPGYRGRRDAIVNLLNEALATELVCVLRYKQHYHTAAGIQSEPVAREFNEHAAEEQEHADRIAARIAQLGGEPDFNPQVLAGRSHSEYVAGRSLVQMIRENLVAERIAIDSYGAMIRFVGDSDPTTRRMLEEILAVEEKHADELADLLAALDPTQQSSPRPT